MALAAGWYLYGTKTGLNVQAIGENPGAADAASIPVNKFKYINLLLGGGICGIGGAYCSMIINGGVWLSDSVGGLGWIAVALVIFAAWKPQLAILGSFVFGGLRVLKYYVPTGAVPIAFFDMLPFLMVMTSRGSKAPHSGFAGCELLPRDGDGRAVNLAESGWGRCPGCCALQRHGRRAILCGIFYWHFIQE